MVPSGRSKDFLKQGQKKCIQYNHREPESNPYVGRWRPQRGFKHVDHFRGLLDSMEHCHVTWRPYEHRRDVTPFQDVCWYSEWIMARKQKMVRHLPEWVLRKYGYVQTVPRPPTTIMPLAPPDVVVAFLEFALHVVAQQQSGDQVPDDEPWKHSDRYIRWFYRVSHPLIVNPAPEPDIVMSRHVYQVGVSTNVSTDRNLHYPQSKLVQWAG